MSTQADADAVRVPCGVGTDESAAETERAILKDGSSVTILPLAAGDEASILGRFASRFAGLSPEKLYARSFSLLQCIDPRVDSRLAHIDCRDHKTITALGPDGVVVGIARFRRVEEARSAEVTVTVSDAWQRRGLASVLLERVAASARSAGIEQLTARCLASELALIRLLSRLGPTVVDQSGAGRLDLQIQLL